MMISLSPATLQAPFVPNTALLKRNFICEGRRRYPLSSLSA